MQKSAGGISTLILLWQEKDAGVGSCRNKTMRHSVSRVNSTLVLLSLRKPRSHQAASVGSEMSFCVSKLSVL